MYTIDEILNSKIVSIDLLQKIRSLYVIDLDRVRISSNTNSQDESEVYYISETGELIPITFIKNEDNQYSAYYYETKQQESSSNKSKRMVLKKPGMTEQSLPENLQPIANLNNNNAIPPFGSTNPYPNTNKAAFAKIGILLTVSILAALFLSSIILLFK